MRYLQIKDSLLPHSRPPEHVDTTLLSLFLTFRYSQSRKIGRIHHQMPDEFHRFFGSCCSHCKKFICVGIRSTICIRYQLSATIIGNVRDSIVFRISSIQYDS